MAVEDLLWLPGAAGHGSPIFYRFAAPRPTVSHSRALSGGQNRIDRRQP